MFNKNGMLVVGNKNFHHCIGQTNFQVWLEQWYCSSCQCLNDFIQEAHDRKSEACCYDLCFHYFKGFTSSLISRSVVHVILINHLVAQTGPL